MDREEILLKEYELCQHDKSSSSTSYWTLAGIFIGVSSAILAGLLYGIFANNSLFQALVKILFSLDEITNDIEIKQVKVVAVCMLLLGIAMIIIICKLWRWLRRTQFLAFRNDERMREIERILKMWKSHIIHGIDNANEDKWGELPIIEREHMSCYKQRDWWKEQKKEAIYEHPSSGSTHKWIFGTLFSLWIIVTLLSIPILIMAYLNKYG